MDATKDILIRKAQFADVSSVYLLICELEEKELPRDYFEQTFRNNLESPLVHYWVAMESSKVIGFISLHEQFLLHHGKPTAEIQELIITSNYRGRGIGEMMLARVLEIAQFKGLEEVELTSNNMRTRAHEFYKSNGFAASHQKLVYKL